MTGEGVGEGGIEWQADDLERWQEGGADWGHCVDDVGCSQCSFG